MTNLKQLNGRLSESSTAALATNRFLMELKPIDVHGVSATVYLSQVWVNSDCCKGVIAFVGKGGAMRVQQGAVNLIECTFANNSARLLGGAVFVDREGRLSTDDVTMSNANCDDHALEGDLMYSIGNVKVRRTRLNVRSASNHVSILCHSGARWSIETVSIEVRCPVGYRLRMTNASIYGIRDDGLIRSYKMDQLSYFCESCPRNKYSLEAGFLDYRFVGRQSTVFTRANVIQSTVSLGPRKIRPRASVICVIMNRTHLLNLLTPCRTKEILKMIKVRGEIISRSVAAYFTQNQ